MLIKNILNIYGGQINIYLIFYLKYFLSPFSLAQLVHRTPVLFFIKIVVSESYP